MIEDRQMKLMRVVIPLAVALWLGLWLYLTRYAMLDDALIHLRYAINLRNLGFFTYNGGSPSYGASSILYVWLLSLLTSVPGVVFLPKVFSAVCYVGLILILLALALRPRLPRAQFYLWLVLLACNLSPMAVRWMPNGMETSMVSLVTASFAIFVVHFAGRASSSPLPFVTLAVFGFILTMLRIELASLAAVAGIVILLGRIDQVKTRRLTFLPLIDSIAPALGAVAALGVIHHIFGSLLPDTAIAKSAHASMEPFFASAQVIASSFDFGLGLFGIAALSAVVLLRELIVRARITLTSVLQWAAANSLLPMLVLLACLRGQAVQSVRYLVWPLLFSSMWNLSKLDRLRGEAAGWGITLQPHILRYTVWVYAILLAICFPVDWNYAVHSMNGHSQTFLRMKGAGLERFKHVTVVAGDIGFIGYFTEGKICDIDGLVNGREAAKEKTAERIADCAKQNPEVLFVNSGQARAVAAAIDLDRWVVCRKVDFTNVHSNDRHYLMVPAAKSHEVCPKDSTSLLKDAVNGS